MMVSVTVSEGGSVKVNERVGMKYRSVMAYVCLLTFNPVCHRWMPAGLWRAGHTQVGVHHHYTHTYTVVGSLLWWVHVCCWAEVACDVYEDMARILSQLFSPTDHLYTQHSATVGGLANIHCRGCRSSSTLLQSLPCARYS